MHLRAGEGKVPIAGEGFGGWEGDVAVVNCGDTEEDIAGEDYAGKPYCQREVC